ncbi:hypothetical protein K3495_g272 [Podosphaera aphanis]|nr:hypothetical protein K3495_g272 [Podosphaera aphanis]
MLLRRIITATARPLRTNIQITSGQYRRVAHAAVEPEYPNMTEHEDPGMNGGYVNPPRVKRQFRDPYGDWWDKQERRNFGEPVHEDNDILGMFSPYEYTHVKPKTAFIQVGYFIVSVLGMMGVVSLCYPDKQSAPREFEGGLEKELGGPNAVRARAPEDN